MAKPLSVSQASNLQAAAYRELSLGSIAPKGWLLDQLTLQAQGLGGHLTQFWPDVMQSVWVGGDADKGLHERTPYWLNGIVPLAFLLRAAGASTKLKPVSGVYLAAAPDATTPPGAPPLRPVDVMAQAQRYVDYILSHQAPSGWLGPNASGGDQYWGPSNVLLALTQFASASRDDPPLYRNISGAIQSHLLEQRRRLKTTPLAGWSYHRWMDQALSTLWLLDNAPLDRETSAELLDLLNLLRAQGVDREAFFEELRANGTSPRMSDKMLHNVNVAQGIKSAAVIARFNASAGMSMAELARRRMETLDTRYGLPTGVFVGDELLPRTQNANRNPSRGSELCGVVESIFSYVTLFRVFGDVAFADRAERIAYNALPATWASPRGGDMWAHQYLQAVNEINAQKADPHVWTHDKDDAELYGLAPNYGCCTANFGQGWPKLATHLFFEDPDGGVVVAMYAPASATFSTGLKVDLETDYPFGDTALVTIAAAVETSVRLRIPCWAVAATVNGIAVKNGTMWEGRAAAGVSTFSLAFKPAVRLERWANGSASVHRGALMYSLPITPKYTVLAHHFGTSSMSNDYALRPSTPWRFALDADPANLGDSLRHKAASSGPSAAPFNHSGWASVIEARLRPLPSWSVVLGSAAAPPESPACVAPFMLCGAADVHPLVPHGGTELRLGEFPLAYFP